MQFRKTMTVDLSFHERAKRIIPGGVNSPVRAFKYVGGEPPVFCAGSGAYVYDADDKQYIDYVGAYGPMIVGHNNKYVLDAAQQTISKGFHFGASHVLELELAQKILKYLPYLDKIRMVSSGTEACMSAVRLARAYTGRSKIIKFNGCYHGHSDSLLVQAGSGALSCGEPSSPGVLQEQAQHTRVANYNDLSSVKAILVNNPDSVAAIIVEPIAGNMGLVLPRSGFLQGLRDLCDEYGALLLFDEVMTGFRVALGGCYELYKVKPDLVMLGKVIGGGFPIGAFAGRDDIMSMLAPDGPVYQAGTLSGSPAALAAGLATLELASAPGFYDKLGANCADLTTGLISIANQYNIDFSANYVGGMFGFSFTKNSPAEFTCFSEAQRQRFIKFFHYMFKAGINLAPSPYEAAFMSISHSKKDIENTLKVAAEFFATQVLG